MGTRADFYIGRGEQAEWLGSIAWDGYPDGLDAKLLGAENEQAFRDEVKALAKRDDWTAPERGWPWPWDDSRTTDYAYAFDAGRVYASGFGYKWFLASEQEPETEGAKEAIFPNMKDRKNVTLGARSGVMILSAHKVDSRNE